MESWATEGRSPLSLSVCPTRLRRPSLHTDVATVNRCPDRSGPPLKHELRPPIGFRGGRLVGHQRDEVTIVLPAGADHRFGSELPESLQPSELRRHGRRSSSTSTSRRTRSGRRCCSASCRWCCSSALFLFLINSMQGGGSRVMQFGKAKARQVSKDEPKVTFADVAGCDEAVEELQEIKEFLQNPARFQAIGAKIPKGVLLYGPARHRQDAARPGRGRRGRRAVLLDLGLRLRRDVRRRRRQPRPRPVRAGQARPPRRSSSWTRSTPSAATAAPASAAATTSGSRRSTRCSSRWTASTPAPA